METFRSKTSQTPIYLIHHSVCLDTGIINLDVIVYMVVFESFGILSLSSIVQLIGFSEVRPSL
jgi:hypothetical protein